MSDSWSSSAEQMIEKDCLNVATIATGGGWHPQKDFSNDQYLLLLLGGLSERATVRATFGWIGLDKTNKKGDSGPSVDYRIWG